MSSTLILHGFAASNYFNVVKLALLEKGLAFEVGGVYPGAGESYRPDYLTQSPLGKVPCLQTEHGFLTESRVILDYLEEVYPEPALQPRAPWARAKQHELTQIIDLYLELAARRVLPNYFARRPAPDAIARDVRDVLTKGARAVSALTRFDQAFLSGERFGAADIAAVIHFPVVRLVAKGVLDFDPFAGIAGLDDYLARMEARPHVQRVRADQSADFPLFAAHLQKRFALGGR